jgi:hypothetical protein
MAKTDKKLDQDSSFFLTDFYCQLKIKGVEFLPQNILEVSIRESIFDLIPILNLTLLDNGILSEKYPLEDGDIIEVTLGSSNLKKPVVSIQFILQDFNMESIDGDNIHLVQIVLTGIMKNKEMFFPIKTRSFPNKSSLDVLKIIATEMEFTPKIDITTSDIMTWRQLKQNNYQMIFDVMKRSFKANDTILAGITRNKEFVITSLMTKLKNKTSKKALYDPLLSISLSNEKSKEKTDIIYFNNFSMSNISGMVNKTLGYGVEYTVYDYDKMSEKKIDSDFHPLTKYSFKNKDNIKKTSKDEGTFFFNKRNMHKNYHDAIVQNNFYSNDFFKNCVILHVNPNNSINIMDLLDITFPSFDNKNGVNLPQSGNYFISSIIHQASKEGYYRMSLVCFRNGINGSSFMKESEFKSSK